MDQTRNQAEELTRDWATNPRWANVTRDYTAEDVIRLRGSISEEHTLARRMAEKLWDELNDADYVNGLGALSGGQAVQMVKAGLRAIYLSGWQVAGDGNLAGEVYPDQSLYPANSAPAMVRRINNALRRAAQMHWAEGHDSNDWFVPIFADAEAGFGGPLNVFELAKVFIDAGAAGIHLEDQLAAEKKCGHMGGMVLVPTSHHVRSLQARVNQLQRRIERLDGRDRISEREARNLREDARDLERRLFRSSRNGLSPREFANIEQRIQRLEYRLMRDANDGNDRRRWGRRGRRSGRGAGAGSDS